MLKMEFKLDESKIKEANMYTPERIYAAIDDASQRNGFKKMRTDDGSIIYQGTNHRNDYALFGRMITSLRKKDWFINNAVKWLWFNSDDGRNENDYHMEDLLYHYTKVKSKP